MISVGLGLGRRVAAPLSLAGGRVGSTTNVGLCFARRVAAMRVLEGPAQPLGLLTGVVSGLVSASRSAVRGSRLGADHAWVSRSVIWLSCSCGYAVCDLRRPPARPTPTTGRT